VLAVLALALGALWGVTRSGAARREAERAAESAAESTSGARVELDAAGAPALEAEGTGAPREAQRTPLAPSSESPAFPRSELAGRVLHADGRPASGIEIEARAQGASERSRPLVIELCAADGSFHLRCLGRGPFELRALRSNVRGTRLQTTLEHVEAGSLALVLTLPPEAVLRGNVVDDLGKPVRSFQVELDGPGLREVRQIQTTDGAFEVDELRAGPWSFVAGGMGHVDSEPRAIMLPLAEPLAVVLVREATLAGVVLGPDGNPLAGAHVSADAFDTNTTGADGAFVVSGPPGVVALVAEDELHAPNEPRPLGLAPGERLDDIVLHLGPASRIDGRAVDLDGRPLAGRLVLLEREGAAYKRSATDRSDEEGRFTAEAAPGRWRVSLDRSRDGLESDEPLPEDVVVATGERVEVLLSPVPRPVRLHGRITKAGAGAAHGFVMLSRLRWRDGAVMNGSDYAVELPQPGRYLLRAQLDGVEQLREIEVPAVSEHRLDLDVRVGWIEGRAREEDGRALDGLPVVAKGKSSSGSSSTDGEGRFVLEVPPGEYEISLAGDAAGTARVAGVEVRESERVTGLELERARRCSLHVRLCDEDGVPLESGQVRVESAGRREVTSAQVSAGSAHYGGLAPGSYRVLAEVRGHELLAAEQVELAPDETRELDLVLVRGRRVFVRVHHREPRPSDLEAIDVAGHVLVFGRTQATPGAAPDAPGTRSAWFQHHTLPPGDYLFRAWTDGRSSLHPLTVPDGAAEPVELELQLP